MFTSPILWLVVAGVFVLNLPFGYWRAGLRKLSPAWFVAIHVPVVLAIVLRLMVGIPFHLIALPIFVAAFFGGQWVGGRLRRWRQRRGRGP